MRRSEKRIGRGPRDWSAVSERLDPGRNVLVTRGAAEAVARLARGQRVRSDPGAGVEKLGADEIRSQADEFAAAVKRMLAEAGARAISFRADYD